MSDAIREARLTLLGRAMLEAAGLDDEKIRKAYTRLYEGLDAMSRKMFQYEGSVVQGPEQTDWTERRESAKELLKLADHYPSKLDVELTGDVKMTLVGLSEDQV